MAPLHEAHRPAPRSQRRASSAAAHPMADGIGVERRLCLVAVLAAGLPVAGCSLWQHRPPTPPPAGGAVQVGTASWYGAELQGSRTASGERFDQRAFTAASRSFPIGTRVRVTNLANGRSVVVRVNDRGPFAPGRVIDVSRAAAQVLGMIDRGTTRVQIESLGEGPPGTVTDRARPRKSRRRGGRTRRAPEG